ncbi:MAG: M56 family metallopeptidase [Lachnospiraceae bacterium]|nr:M56 family metallopeptidase [Lachnospiraceae bacterium]
MKVLDIFVQILNMAVTGTFVILAVLLARGLMGRFPRKYAYALWLIVGIRLVCPVAVYSPVSLFNLDFMENSYTVVREAVGEDETAATEPDHQKGETYSGRTQMTDQMSESLSVLPDQSLERAGTDAENADMATETNYEEETEEVGAAAVEGAEDAEGVTRGADADTHAAAGQSGLPVGMLRWMAVIWLAGMVIFISWNIVLTARLRKKLGRAVLYRDNIYESDTIPSPFVMGIFSPRIYIPFRLSDREREYILKHEQYHIHRRDYIIKIIAFLITSVYWFHPLVWVSYFSMVRDMEISCDEHVLSEMEEDVRQDYSRSLLAFASNERRFSLGTLAFGETDTRNRIKHVLNFKKKGKWMSVPAIVLFVLVGTACLTNGQSSGTPARESGSVTGEAVTATGTAVSDNPDSEPDESESLEQKLWQAIRNTMPQTVVEELERGKCRRTQDKKGEVSYLFSNKESYEGETLRLDFSYKKDVLKQYVAKEYGFLELLSIKMSEIWHESETTEEELEDRAKELIQQFDREFLDRDGNSGYYRVKTPARYADEDTPNMYMCFKDYTYGDTYLVCLMYDMVLQYDATNDAAKKKKIAKSDEEIRIAYKDPDTPNGQWEYYIPKYYQQRMLQDYAHQLEMHGYDSEQEEMRQSLLKEKETGLALYYKGEYWIVYTGGYLSRDYGDGKVTYSAKFRHMAEDFLSEGLDYNARIEPEDIHNITSAALVYISAENPERNRKRLEITDASQLAMLEKAFSKAKYIRGGSDCPFGETTLWLRRDGEKEIILTLAGDGCHIFRLHGVCYKYDDSGFSSSLKETLKEFTEAV